MLRFAQHAIGVVASVATQSRRRKDIQHACLVSTSSLPNPYVIPGSLSKTGAPGIQGNQMLLDARSRGNHSIRGGILDKEFCFHDREVLVADQKMATARENVAIGLLEGRRSCHHERLRKNISDIRGGKNPTSSDGVFKASVSRWPPNGLLEYRASFSSRETHTHSG
jgi:hypothetical protein